MSKETPTEPCPKSHRVFRFCVRQHKPKKRTQKFDKSALVKELGPGNKNWFENATAQKILEKKQKPDERYVSLCTPEAKIHADVSTSTDKSSDSSETKFYCKIQRLLTSQTSTPSESAEWLAPMVGISPEVVSGSAPICSQSHIKRSLGVDLDDSVLSWTSSLATPTLMASHQGTVSPVAKQQKGLPRVLFSPGPSQTDEELHALDNTSEENTDEDLHFGFSSKMGLDLAGKQSRNGMLMPIVNTAVVKPVQTSDNRIVDVSRRTEKLQESCATDLDQSLNVLKTDFKEELNTDSNLSPDFVKNDAHRTQVYEESSMPLFSQDFCMDDDVDVDIKNLECRTTESPRDVPNGNDKMGMSDALSDFFDPPSSAVGKRRCAPRKGRKRQSFDYGLTLEMCSDKDICTTPLSVGKKCKGALSSEKDKTDQGRLISLNSEENDSVLSTDVDKMGSEICCTPVNTQNTIKSILSTKKKREKSASTSTKKVRFALEEQPALKRNVRQLSDDVCVSPEVFVQAMLQEDCRSDQNPTFSSDGSKRTKLVSDFVEPEDIGNDMATINSETGPGRTDSKSTTLKIDIETCDDLFSQVSPTALNEMCSVGGTVTEGSKRTSPVLGNDSSHSSFSIKTEVTNSPVTVKTENEGYLTISSSYGTKDKNPVNTSVVKMEDKSVIEIPITKSANSTGTSQTSLRNSINLKPKTRKFLYPSTNQISKSCPKSVYGFAEQTEKNRLMTLNPKDSTVVDMSGLVDSPSHTNRNPDRPAIHGHLDQSAIHGHPAADRPAIHEQLDRLADDGHPDRAEIHGHPYRRAVNGNPDRPPTLGHQDRPVIHLGIRRPAAKKQGFESFSMLARSGKLSSELDSLDDAEKLAAKILQKGPFDIEPNTEQLYRNVVRPNSGSEDKMKTARIDGVISDQKFPCVQFPLKTEPNTADFYTSLKSETSKICGPDRNGHASGEEISPPKYATAKSVPTHSGDNVYSVTGKQINMIEPVHKVSDSLNLVDKSKNVDEESVDVSNKANYMESESANVSRNDNYMENRTVHVPINGNHIECRINPLDVKSQVSRSHMKDNALHTSENGDQDIAEPQRDGKTFGGFSFASGKSMSCSEERLENARKLLVSVDSDTGVSDDFSPEFLDMCRAKTRGILHPKPDMMLPQRTSTVCYAEDNEAVLSPAARLSSTAKKPGKDFEDVLENVLISRKSPVHCRHVPLSKMSQSTAMSHETDIESPGTVKKTGQDLEDILKNVLMSRKSPLRSHPIPSNHGSTMSATSIETGHNESPVTATKPGQAVEDLLNNVLMSRKSPLRSHQIPSNHGSTMSATSIETGHNESPVTATKPGQAVEDLLNNVLMSRKSPLRSHQIPSNHGSTMSATSIETGHNESPVTATKPGQDVEDLLNNVLMSRNSPLLCRPSNGSLTAGGFKTAGGKELKLSNSSLKKASSLLEDVGIEYPQPEGSMMSDADAGQSGFQSMGSHSNRHKLQKKTDGRSLGFRSSGGKAFQPSDSSIKKALCLFGEVDKELNQMKDMYSSEEVMTAQIFGTARGKLQQRTTADVEKAVGVVEDEDMKDSARVKNSDLETSPSVLGFSTASGHKLQLSEAGMKKALSLVGEVDKEMSAVSDGSNVVKDSKETRFNTSDGKRPQLGISMKEKAELMIETMHKGKADCFNDFSIATEMSGFSTAGGKKLKLSNTGMKRAMSLVGNVDKEMADTTKNIMDDGFNNNLTSGFSTAGGKKLKLSSPNMKRAMSLVGDIDKEMADTAKYIMDDGFNNNFTSAIGTAAAKNVHNNDSSVSNATFVFEDVENSLNDDFAKTSSVVGFQTASDKCLQISVSSVKKAMSIMGDGDAALSEDSKKWTDIEMAGEDVGKEKPQDIELSDGLGEGVNCLGFNQRPSVVKVLAQSELQTNRDEGLKEINSRRASSRFPPGAVVPKGFRPFKPPKITRKSQAEAEKEKDELCMVNATKVQMLKSAEIAVASENSPCSKPLTKDPDSTKDKEKEFLKGSNRELDIQDMDHSIMDEFFSEELVSSQKFSPGSGKVMKSQSVFLENRRTEELHCEEKENLLDIERKVGCDDKEVCDDELVGQVNKGSGRSGSLGCSDKDRIKADVEVETLHRATNDKVSKMEIDGPIESTTESMGFQSVSRKHTTASEDVVKKVEQQADSRSAWLNEESGNRSVGISEESTFLMETSDQRTTGFSGFWCGSGKCVSVSEEALLKAKQSFMDNDTESDVYNAVFKDEPTEKQIVGWYEDSGKTASVSDGDATKALHDTADRSSDIDAKPFSDQSTEIPPLNTSGTGFSGFACASGKEVRISEDALVKAKQNIKNWSSDQDCLNTEMITSNSMDKQSKDEFTGFQSASGKTVSVSMEALRHAKQRTRDWTLHGGDDLLSSEKYNVTQEAADDSKEDNSTVTGNEADSQIVSISGANNPNMDDDQLIVPKLECDQGICDTTRDSVTGKGTSGTQAHTDHIALQEIMNSQYDFTQCDSDMEIDSMQDFDRVVEDVNQTSLGNKEISEPENVKRHADLPEKVGFLFESASGKKISVSKDALQHARKTKDSFENNVLQHASEKRMNGPEVFLKSASECHENSSFQCDSGKTVSEKLRSRKTKSDVANSPFQSASGKSVSISEKALKHAKKTMEDIENISEKDLQHGRKTMEDVENSPFQSASGKTISISEKALQHARKSMDDVENSSCQSVAGKIISISEKGLQQHARKTMEDIVNSPFQSASGNSVNISERALHYARKTTVDVENSPFQSASGKSVTISEKALQHSRKTMDDDETSPFQSASGKTVSFSEKALQHARKTTVDVENSPFQSASGKIVNTSEKALQHARKTMDDVENSPFQSASGNSVSFSEKTLQQARKSMEDVENSPFQSASGKTVSFSEKALQHARKTMDDVENSPFQSASGKTVSFSEKALQHTRKTTVDVENSPFQSASGKIVNISEKALQHARKTMDDVENSPFQSASGNSVSFSEKALQQARKSMEDVENSPFQSASGKTVSFSEKALQHARKTMDDVENSPFQSASGISLNISGKALQHARKTMDDVENSPFQSASGKTVNISENALQHAWKAMDNIENSPFQSASGSTIALSAEALQQARRTLKDEGSYPTVTNTNTIPQRPPQPARKSIKGPEHSPFQTAIGRNVSVSECSLEHARKGMQDSQPGPVIVNIDKGNFSESHHHTKDTERRDTKRHCHSIQDSVSSTSHKVPKMKYQIRNLPVKDQNSTCHLTGESGNQRQQRDSRDDEEPLSARRQQHRTNGLSGRTDRRVFIEEMDYDLDEFCKPEDFLEDMEVTPKRRKIEDTAVRNKTGMVKPLKCVPEAFTRDRPGTNLRALHSTARPPTGTTSRLSSLFSISKDANKSQPAKSSFLTPYKKSTASDQSSTSTIPITDCQVSRKATPKFIPKCLAVPQVDLTKSGPLQDDKDTSKDQSKDNKMDNSDKKVDISKLLVEARQHQSELISLKDKVKVKPVPGRLYVTKQHSKRIRMRDVISLHKSSAKNSPLFHQTVKVGDLRSANTGQHRFYLPDFYTNFQGQVYVGDGAYLVPDDQLYAGKQELFRAFCTLEGVDCKLISDAWFYNHYRWLVWKLAAYEVTSPYNFAGRALTPEVVMLQMKYRYDREIDNCQRSALKKIMERDDTAGKRMVLCVSAIVQSPDVVPKQAGKSNVTGKQETSAAKLDTEVCVQLTDGWYCITAKLDVPLTDLVHKHKIDVGHKLCIGGAELVGSQDACSPLEAPASLMLKLNANSTHPALWDARLGYQSDPRPLCVPLSGLYGEGGAVGCLDVVLARKYPQMYMEKLEEGGCVFRTCQAEDKVQRQHQQRRQAEMEKLYAKLQSEFEKEEEEEKCISKKKWTKKEVEHLQTGQEIYEAYCTSRLPDMIEENLSDHQRELLLEHRRYVQDAKQQKLHAEFQKTWQTTSERNVVPLLKMKIVGCSRKDMDSKASTVVTVWRPTQDVLELVEGTRYRIFGMNASSSRSRYNQGDVQLTATRQTRFMPMPIDENVLDMIYEPREVLSVNDIRSRQPLYGEADFVGVMVAVSNVDFAESGKHQDIVYAADASGSVLGIKFWGGLKSFCVEDILTEGRLFCASNLMDKSLYRSSVLPLLEASLECSVISQNSQYPAQRMALDRLKTASLDKTGFLENAKEALASQHQKKMEHGRKFTPEKKNNSGVVDPLDSILKTPVDRTPASMPSSTPAPTEGSTSRPSRSVYQARMARLLSFGSPGPLSPLVSKGSQSANKDFKPPMVHRKSLGPNH